MLGSHRPGIEVTVLQAWGDVIRRYRQWKELSRRELAQQAGLSPVFLGEIERGEKDSSAHTLCLLAEALQAPLAELYIRVAARLDGAGRQPTLTGQTSFPLGLREAGSDYLDGVPRAKDETAFDLYKIVRLLPTDQQVSLVVLVQSLLAGQRDTVAQQESERDDAGDDSGAIDQS